MWCVVVVITNYNELQCISGRIRQFLMIVFFNDIFYMIVFFLLKSTPEKINDFVFVDNKNYEVLQVDFLELYGFILASVFSFRRKS